MSDLNPANPVVDAPPPGTPLILVGMMGSGKTTVGRRLALRLGRQFIDLDKELEARCGVPVATIFELEGEAGFRQRESLLIEELSVRQDLVIATGGGAVLSETNRRLLRERGYVIHLRASLPELWHRLRHDRVRPLLRTADPRARIAELLQARDPLYEEVAHLSVLTGRQPADRVVVDIIGLLPPGLLALASTDAGGPLVPDPARLTIGRAMPEPGLPTELHPIASRSVEPGQSVAEAGSLILPVTLGERSYPIHIGSGLLAAPAPLIELARGRQVALISNEVVAPRYAGPLEAALRPVAQQFERVILPDGEAHKNWTTLNLIFDALLAARFDRRCLVVALGGGVIGDMAGFAAAVYQRGVDFVQVPTTLLAQVDSSVGGKTAINHPAGKNMIGSFHQPRLVLADVGSLRSLPTRELAAGLAEVIKHGLIVGGDYLAQIERDLPGLLAFDTDALRDAVAGSCRIKADIVARDERESGVRAFLNLGHTFGHAVETGLGYGEWLHGEAVGCGLVMAADLSHRLGLLSRADVERTTRLVAAAGLPIRGPAWAPEAYLARMEVDKKAEQGVPRFVLLEGIGRPVLRKVDRAALFATLAACSG